MTEQPTNTTQGLGRVRSLTYLKLLEKSTGPIPYLIDEVIPSNSLGILVGNWGIGKSPFALQLQLSLAAGLPFLGRYKPAKAAKCLYVDLENGAQPVLNIVATISKYLGLAEVPESWSAYSPNYCSKEEDESNLAEDVYVIRAILAERPDFIIIDPLRMFKPEAESKNAEAAQLISKLRKIIHIVGCSILLIHHPRKPSSDEMASMTRPQLDKNPSEWLSQACGAAALIQNTDFRIGLEATDEGPLVMRRFVRNIGWSPAEYVSREFDEDDGEPIGFTMETGIRKLDALERERLDHLPSPFTTASCKAAMGGLHNEIVQKWLKRLQHLMIIKRVGRGLYEKL